ncbi:hypothetical protein AB3_0024 [Acinetobacter phage AB3]|uniref:Uncharacterized protein n=2 Tax=Friunavirus TaxID=1985711 RepID=A0AAE9HFS2_9CAUD|nr:hypothetical protein AB3_0024 [Acinetobacter phage AB3]AGC35325.1 hypothetical protein AB3_0024 [Acinetobacter phage AB3]UPT53540.1 hypothetical protein ZHSHW_24 [Acinetobacter phage vB_AbaP_ZHSHW]WGV35657.1 hypothetical protein EPabB_20 [Acinetobacter phage vB_AbaP_EPab_B]
MLLEDADVQLSLKTWYLKSCSAVQVYAVMEHIRSAGHYNVQLERRPSPTYKHCDAQKVCPNKLRYITITREDLYDILGV